MHGISRRRFAVVVGGALLTLAMLPSGTFAASIPIITSANNASFTVGVAGTFTVTATGDPSPSISEAGALPTGVTLVDNGGGFATLSGTPAAGSNPSYSITIRASNGTIDATQTFFLSVNPGTVPLTTHLVFLSQPGGGAAGAIWATQPVVEVVNSLNQVVTTDNSTVVYLSIGTNPAGGTLSCTGGTSEVVVNGYAYFSGCSINIGSASPYTLTATSSPVWTPATSSAFYVGGSVLHVAFLTQPGGGAPGAIWTTQPVVALETSSNAVVTDSTTYVYLSIATNPAGGTLSCTSGTTMRLTNGYAYFSGCSINIGSASQYTLTATSSPVWTPATSSAFYVGGSSENLVFLTQPGGGAPGAIWTQQPVVEVVNSLNQVVTTDNTTYVYLSIATNPAGGTLSCTSGTTLRVTNGYAYFSGCSINIGSASQYTLTATSSPVWTPATSSAFYVGGSSENLVFLTQPGGGAPGAIWTQQPVVEVVNSLNQVVTTDNTTYVYLSIATNPAGGTLSCTSGTTLRVTNGYAYFSGCSINIGSASQYTLTATSSPVWTPATSSAFYVGGSSENLVFLTQPGGGAPGPSGPSSRWSRS